MKTINRDELYQNLSEFLKAKGIELKDGKYPLRVREGCNLLTDAINATQKAVERTKIGVDKKLNKLRQSIHEATAPKSPKSSPTAKPHPHRQRSPAAKKPRKPRNAPGTSAKASRSQ